MNNQQLAKELSSLREHLTPGPWRWWMSEKPPFDFANEDSVNIGIQASRGADAEFVAHVRNHLDQIIDALESS